MIYEYCSWLIFATTAPFKLIVGKKLKLDRDILNASVGTAFLSDCHDTYLGI